jgi:hypothetical protein
VKIDRRLVVGGVAVALVAGGGGALAAQKLGASPAQERNAFLNDVAGRLGVDRSKLDAALKGAFKARIDAAVASGRLTKQQGDRLKARIEAGSFPLLGHRGLRGFDGGLRGLHLAGRGVLLRAATSYLGIGAADLRTAVGAGKSLADVARAQGKSVQGLEDALVAALRQRLDRAVAAGHLTAAARDRALARLADHVAALVNGTLEGRPGFHRGSFLLPGRG